MRRTVFAVFVIAALGACSSSDGPTATLVGTWHVTFGPIGSGNLSPGSLDFVVTAAGSHSYHVTVPAITWSIGPVVYDSTPTMATFSDTTYWGFRVAPSNPTQRCDQVLVYGQPNPGKDTLLSAGVQVFHHDTVAGGYCTPQADGEIIVHK